VLSDAKVDWDYWALGNDTYVDRARNTIASMFYRSDFTDLVFIDSDISWDVQGLANLLASPFDVTGGLFPKKGKWEQYTGKIKLNSESCPIQDPATELLEAEFLPAGFLRITKSCITKLTEAYQHDWYKERDEKVVRLFACETTDNQYIGEDVSFCRKWQQMGGKCYIEPRIKFGHTGTRTSDGSFYEFLLRIAEETRIQVAINGGVKNVSL